MGTREIYGFVFDRYKGVLNVSLWNQTQVKKIYIYFCLIDFLNYYLYLIMRALFCLYYLGSCMLWFWKSRKICLVIYQRFYFIKNSHKVINDSHNSTPKFDKLFINFNRESFPSVKYDISSMQIFNKMSSPIRNWNDVSNSKLLYW